MRKKPIKIKNNILKKVYKIRSKKSHKGDYGKLLIIGGNEKYTGAPVLNSLSAISAYKTGTDIVELIAPKRAADIAAGFSPDIITYPLTGRYISKRHLNKILEETKDKTAFVIGGGIGKKQETLNTIREFLSKVSIKGVIDAEAIHSISPEKIKNKKTDLSKFIITPHEKEFEILTGKKILKDFSLKKKIALIQQQAKKLNTTILLKGPTDIISDGEKTAINKTGNPYMTKAGTGDVLAGIIGSLIAQKNSLFDSACAGAYINGKSAEKTKKKISLTASDLIKSIEKIVG